MADSTQSRPILHFAYAGRAVDGSVSGDLHFVALLPHRALLAVVDGLGHGPEAALASNAAASTLQLHAGLALGELIDRCHEALRKTRGAVMSLVALDAQSSTLEWCGVGNVEGVLLRANSIPGRGREALICRGGVVGYRLPVVKVHRTSISPNDLLILTTDGIQSDFVDVIERDHDPQKIADAVLASCAKASDDALILVGRYLGST